MDRETFQSRLAQAAAKARDFARDFIEEELPDAVRFRVWLNSSFDGDPLHEDEVVFPRDSDPAASAKLSNVTSDMVVNALWREGLVPEWVNLSVIGRTADATMLEVRSCGRYTGNEALLYHEQEGYPPFHVLGPALPPGWKEGQTFSLYHRAQASSRGELALIEPHAEKVWSLELVGADFDDAALSELPAMPGLKSLELKSSPIKGPGLARLDRHASLAVIRGHLASPSRLSLPDMDPMEGIEQLALSNLPASSWGFEKIERTFPNLQRLRLASAHELPLGSSCPAELREFSLEAPSIKGVCRLPARLDRLSLHLDSIDEDSLHKLLASVRDVRALHLRHTPVRAELAAELVTRCAPEYIDVVDTAMSEDDVRALGEQFPKLRMHPRLEPLVEVE